MHQSAQRAVGSSGHLGQYNAPSAARRALTMAYVDTALTCSDCEMTFMFTARDQETYVANGFVVPPNRCANCRQVSRVGASSAPGCPAS